MDYTKKDNIKLNLGGGRKRYPGFLNVDKAALPETDLQWNLEKVPLPFADNSVSKIISEHALEHVFNFVELLEEMYRITKPGGIWEIVVPYYKYEGTFRDPTHRCFFSENTFDYFKEGNTFDYYSTIRLRILKKDLRNCTKTNIPTAIKKIRQFIPFKRFFNLFLWNMYSEIYFKMQVVKDSAADDRNRKNKDRVNNWRACER